MPSAAPAAARSARSQPQPPSLEKAARECDSLFSRRFYEMAHATLDDLGGDESPDPRVSYLAACCHLGNLRFGKAAHVLAHTRETLEKHPQSRVILAGTVFENLPQAISLLLGAIERQQAPMLKVSPFDFAKSPSEAKLHLTGGDKASMGRPIDPRPEYRAGSLVKAEAASGGPPRMPMPPRLSEPIRIRTGDIQIIGEPIRIVTEPIVIRDREISSITAPAAPSAPSSAARQAAARQAARAAQYPRGERSDAASLEDKAKILERIRTAMRTQGGQVQALAVAQQAVARYPQSASVREAYAQVLEAVGRNDQAAHTYLAAAHLALSDPQRRGRLEHCLQRACALGAEDIGFLRDALAAAQRAGLSEIEKEVLGHLLRLDDAISDPLQRGVWLRRLKAIDPANPLLQSAQGRTELASGLPVFQSPVSTTGGQGGGMGGELGGGVSFDGSQTSATPISSGLDQQIPEWQGGQSAQGALGAPAYAPPSSFAPTAPAKPGAAPPAQPSWPAVSPPGSMPSGPAAGPGPMPSMGGSFSAPAALPAPPAPPAAAPSAPFAAVKPPQAASRGTAKRTFPCFYCGKPVSYSQDTCPSCKNQQPAFLLERARQALSTPPFPDADGGLNADADANTTTTSGKKSPFEAFPLPRPKPRSSDEKSKEAPEAIAKIIPAFFLLFAGLATGSSIMCIISFFFAGSAAKSPNAGPGIKAVTIVLRILAAIGFISGFGRGIP